MTPKLNPVKYKKLDKEIYSTNLVYVLVMFSIFYLQSEDWQDCVF